MILNYNNTQIYYEFKGQGPVLVLLHGFLESSTMWNRFISKIDNSKTILTIDLPGHGKSGSFDLVHSMELMAEVVLAIFIKHDIKSATFIGHSMGGYVALAFAESYNDKVDKLILLNSTPAEDSEERKLNRDRAIKIIKQNSEAFISMAISNLFIESTQNQYANQIQEMKKEVLRYPINGIIATILGMKTRKDRSLILKEFQKEKIMICGIDDPIIPFEVSKSLSLQTGAILKKVTGGHMSLVENFHEIVKICISS